MRVLNVTHLTPGNLDQTLPELLQRQRALGSEDFAFLCRVFPEQEPIRRGLQNHLEVFARARDFFKKEGIRSGILIQTLIGHGERCEWPSPVSFQRIIGLNGVRSQATYCPLDQDFVQFACDGTRRIAEQRPDWILVDDDLRMDAHWPANVGCFCPLHLARFEEMFGERHELADLREKLAADNEAGRRLRQQWLEVDADGLWALLRRMRAEIDAVDPDIPGGICTVASQTTFNRESCRIFAGRGRPLLRVGGAVYLDRDSKKLPISLDSLARQRRQVPADYEVLCESDTYPHHRYSLSAHKLQAYLKTCALLGFDGAKAWVQHTYGFIPNENERYFQSYAETQAFSAHVRGWIKDVEWQGIACPTSPADLAYFPWTDTGGKNHMLSLWVEALGRMGIPWIPGANAGAICAFEGVSVEAFPDADWTTMLSGNIWLDGRAALILQQRGLGDLLGVRLEEDTGFYTSAEHFLDLPQWNRKASNRMNMAARREAASVMRMEPLSEVTTVLSEYVRWPAWGCPQEHERVGASVTVFENSLGGKVMVYAGCLPAVYDLQVVHPFRREQFLAVTRWMDASAFPWEVVSESDLMVLQGHHPEHGELLYLLNLNQDSEPEIVLRRQPFRECRVELLDAVLGWVPAICQSRGDSLVIDHLLAHLDPILLRFVPLHPKSF